MALTQIDDRGLKTPIDLLDNEKIRFGTGNDLGIYHSGTNTFIENSTGPLKIRSDTLELGAANGEQMLQGTANSTVNLYYDGSKKLETTSTGVTISSSSSADGLKIISTGNTYNEISFDADRTNASNHLGRFVAKWDGNTVSYISMDSGDDTTNKDDGIIRFFTSPDSGTGTVERVRIKNDGNLKLPDSAKIELGGTQSGSGDLQIYHNGTNSFITNSTGYLHIDSNGGTLYLDGSNINLRSGDGGETYAVCNDDGAVELYYNNVKQFETTSAGIRVLGGEGEAAYIYMSADEGDDNADKWVHSIGTDGIYTLQNYTSGSWEKSIQATGNGAVELYYDNSKKLETYGSGIHMHGNINIQSANHVFLEDNGCAKFGNANDLLIYHDGTDSFIENSTGKLYLKTTTFIDIRGNGNETMMKGTVDGSVELYYDNSKKFETNSGGVEVTGGTLNMDSTAMQFSGNLTLPNVGACLFRPAADTVAFGINNGQRVSVNQYGLLFGTDTAAANALDDYEEGTWTPNPLFGSTDAGETADVNGGMYARYTKIGNLVYCHFSVNFSGRSGSASGNFKLDGLPFAISANNWNEDGGTVHYYTGLTSPKSPPTIMCENTNRVGFYQSNTEIRDNAVTTWNEAMDTNEIGTGAIRIRGSFTYHTAA